MYCTALLSLHFWQFFQVTKSRERKSHPKSILPNFFLHKKKIFLHFLLLRLAVLKYRHFFLCYKHSSLTAKIGKRRKTKFGRINSRKTVQRFFFLLLFHFLTSFCTTIADSSMFGPLLELGLCKRSRSVKDLK